MPFDVVAFLETQTATALSNVAVVSDPVYQVSGDDLTVKKQASFLAGLLHLGVTTPKVAEIRQPSLKIPYRFVKSALTTVVDHRAGFTNLYDRPLPLYAGEKLNALVQNATAEYSIVALWLTSGYVKPEPITPTHVINADIDSTLTVNVWNTVTPTFNQSLPKGRYAIIGMKFGSYLATCNPAVARLVLPETQWRPGVVTSEISADKTNFVNAKGDNEGRWGLMNEISFPHDNMPKLEVLSLTADTDHMLELTLRKIA